MGKSGGASRRGSSKPATRVAERRGGVNRPGVRGTGSYFARETKRPHEDIKRGWTAGMGVKEPSPEKAILHWISDRYGGGEVVWNLEEPWKEQHNNAIAEAQYEGKPYHGPMRMEDDAKFMDQVARDYRITVREASPGQWVVYDHPGLAGYKVTLSDNRREPNTDDEAATIASQRRDMYRFNYHAGEDGDATVGHVRYIRDLGNGLHLFWAEKVVPENDVRENPLAQ